jgi:hypothetical protein
MITLKAAFGILCEVYGGEIRMPTLANGEILWYLR